MISSEKAFKVVSGLVKDFKKNENYFYCKKIDQLACLLVRLVYQLYALTEEEIKIVEESVK